jgi:hypothetical protein
MQNKQNPPVHMDHIIAAGLSLFIDHPSVYNHYFRDGINVYGKHDEFICSFDDVCWGHGACGLLFANGNPISDLPVDIKKVEEIRSARQKIEEAKLHAHNNRMPQGWGKREVLKRLHSAKSPNDA